MMGLCPLHNAFYMLTLYADAHLQQFLINCSGFPPDYIKLTFLVKPRLVILFSEKYNSFTHFCQCSYLFRQFSCIFFYHFARHHDLVSAAHAFQPEICSYTKDLPLLASTWMTFLEGYNIPHFINKFHALSAPLSYFNLRKYLTDRLLDQKICIAVTRSR